MKIDFHIHTKYSPDSFTTLEVLNKVCKKKGLFPVITDHDTIKGALEFKKHFGPCIIGEEVDTKQGDLIGLFLNEEIPRKIDVYEAVDRIREQGALVYMPHPFDKVRSSALKVHDFKADIVEVFNARVMLQNYNKKADEYADKHKLLKAVGSDAHFSREIGTCYAEMDSFDDIKGFKQSLRKARLVKATSSPFVLPAAKFVHCYKNPIHMLKKFLR
ncbi:MAG: PHP domain-containing protein [Nanoarchaeota archaeon]|nr:PHP domain-containing protein [Nanoarchaeota archaeon]